MSRRLVFDLDAICDGKLQVDNFRSELATNTLQVRNESIRSESTFAGTAGNRFREVTEEWLGVSKELDAALTAMSEWLKDTGDGYQNALQVNRAMFGGQ